jgi:excisionase family DNA binding protein
MITDFFHEVLTIPEAAAELRCSKSHISHLVNGKVPNVPPMPHVRVGRRVLIRRSSFKQWMELIESHQKMLQ